MAKRKSSSYTQIVYSAPQKILIGKYLTKKGKRLLETSALPVEEIWKKYGKNRYESNPDAVPLRDGGGKLIQINHIIKKSKTS